MDISKINNYINPFSKEYDKTINDFKKLNTKQKVTIVAFSILVGAVTVGFGGVAVFKVLVRHFKLINKNSDNPQTVVVTTDLVVKKLFKETSNPVSISDQVIQDFSSKFQDQPEIVHEEKTIVDEAVKSLSNEMIHLSYEKGINQFITAKLSNEDLPSFVAATKPFCQWIKNQKQAQEIFNLIQALSKDQREFFTHEIMLLMDEMQNGKGMMNPEEIADLFFFLVDHIQDTPPDQQTSLINRERLLLKNISEKDDKLAILRKIKEFSSVERECTIKLIVPLCEGLNKYEIEKILEGIQEIPFANRAVVIKIANPLLHNDMGEDEKVEILKLINEISPNENESVVQMVLSLNGQEKPEMYDNLAFLSIIQEIDANERQAIIDLVLPMCQGLRAHEKIDVLEVIRNVSIPIHEKKAMIELTMPLLNQIDSTDPNQAKLKTEILKEIMQLSLIEIKSIINATLPLCENIQDNRKIKLLKIIQATPINQREEIKNQILPLYKDKDKLTRSALIQALYFLPASAFSTIFETLNDKNLDTDFIRIISEILRSNINLKPSFYDYWMIKIQSTDEIVVEEFADFILDHFTALLIPNEDHLLFQEAIRKKLQLTTTDPKNSFVIYNKLKDELQQPTPAFKMPKQLIDGTQLTWNLETLRKNSVEKKEITFDQLPKDVKSDTISKMFETLEKRLEDHPNSDSIKKYILESSGDSFEKLKENFTTDYFINILLNAEGTELQVASPDIVRFRMIVKHILDQSNERKEGQLLSDQEENLIKISASIQHCSTGKSEGIALAYNLLPITYRYGKEKANFQSQEDAISYLNRSLQQALNEIFSNQNLLKEMIGSEEINQASHQTLFLKNRLGARVGLQEPLKLDPHSILIDDSLVKKDLSESLQIFFKHFQPNQLISLLQNNFIKDKNSVNQLYGTLTSLVPHVPIQEVWDLDEDQIEIEGLTERGAKEMLMAAKLIETVE